MPDPLFNRIALRDFLIEQENQLAKEINSLTERQALNSSPEDLVNHFVEKYQIDGVEINESGIQTDYNDIQIDVSNRFDYDFLNRSGPAYVTGTRITFYVPFSGDPRLLTCQPSTYSLSPPRADIRDEELVFVYDRTTQDAPKVGNEFNRDIESAKTHINQIAKDTQNYRSTLRQQAKQLMDQRRAKLLRDRGISESLGFPLRRRSGVPTTYVTPEVKRRVIPRLPNTTDPFMPEPTLDIDEYEHILSVISNMVMVMERSPSAFKNMGEEDLRQHFLVQLNGHYEGQATGETFNFNGKTDILIRTEGKNIFIAECKFWSGPSGLNEAIDQLLGYTSWRDTKTALLVFNRDRNMSTVLESIPEVAKKHPKYKRESQSDSETGFRFIFSHRDDTNKELTMTILVFDIPN